MKKKYHRKWTDNAHGDSCSREMQNVARKVARSTYVLLRGVGRGLLKAVETWTKAAPARGGW